MRYEVVEILADNTISVLLSTSSRDYADRYLRFLNFKYGDYRDFALTDKKRYLSMNICKNIKIRILAFMMAFWLAFSVSYNDYQEVKALEWAIPTVAFDTALKFLLGLLGVSLTSKALHDNVDWNQVQQNCMDYQIQKGMMPLLLVNGGKMSQKVL